MPWINRLLALALIAGALPLWFLADEFPGTAKAFPHVLLVVIVLLAVALILRSLVPAVVQGSESEGQADPLAMVKPLAAFAAAVGGVAVMHYVGFFPAMVVFSVVLYPILRVENRRLFVAAVIVLLVFVYLIFVLLLDVPLMAGRMFQG